jgi:hypothetical protein
VGCDANHDVPLEKLVRLIVFIKSHQMKTMSRRPSKVEEGWREP